MDGLKNIFILIRRRRRKSPPNQQNFHKDKKNFCWLSGKKKLEWPFYKKENLSCYFSTTRKKKKKKIWKDFRFEIQMNTILVIYTFQFLSVLCIFFSVVYICRKSEKNENFDLPYVYINYETLCCKHKTKLTRCLYIRITKTDNPT